MKKFALMFPGQGSQSSGMCVALAKRYGRPVEDVLAAADEALGFSLSRLMRSGPIEELTKTEHAQPALVAASAAYAAALRIERGDDFAASSDQCACVMGHSLGEFSALVLAGAMSLQDALRVVRLRGRAMQRAADASPLEHAMVAVYPLEDPAVAGTFARDAGCSVANVNSDVQVVFSGERGAVERAVALAKDAQDTRLRATPLAVSAPFHSTIVAPAADALRDALGSVRIRTPDAPLVSNVTAQLVREPDEIRALLVSQVVSTVRWSECVLLARELQVSAAIEVGPGSVLSRLAPRMGVEGVSADSILLP